MGNLRKTAFLKESFGLLFKNEREYMQNLIRSLLFIQNSQAPQRDTHPESRKGKKGREVC
jgi:hypothetical protein